MPLTTQRLLSLDLITQPGIVLATVPSLPWHHRARTPLHVHRHHNSRGRNALRTGGHLNSHHHPFKHPATSFALCAARSRRPMPSFSSRQPPYHMWRIYPPSRVPKQHQTAQQRGILKPYSSQARRWHISGTRGSVLLVAHVYIHIASRPIPRHVQRSNLPQAHVRK